MLSQEKVFCQEKKQTVVALMETKKGCKRAIGCNDMLQCSAATFCRYVNPLTTRNPLIELAEAAAV